MNRDKFKPIKLNVQEFLGRECVLKAENTYLKMINAAYEEQPINTFKEQNNATER